MGRPIVMITGASRGIGAAIAKTLAGELRYHFILICKENKKALQTITDTIHSIDDKALVYPVLLDLSDSAKVESTFSKIEANFGAPDILINNAGIAHIGLLQDMSFETIQTLLNTNLTSAILLSKLCIPHMIKKVHESNFSAGSQAAASIINISSVWGNCGASCEVVYSAAKGGINSFTKALAKELAPSGIPVNALACGMVDTEMNHCLSKDDRLEIENEIPIGRIATAQEIATSCALLLKMPNYLTGQIITIDGGWT